MPLWSGDEQPVLVEAVPKDEAERLAVEKNLAANKLGATCYRFVPVRADLVPKRVIGRR